MSEYDNVVDNHDLSIEQIKLLEDIDTFLAENGVDIQWDDRYDDWDDHDVPMSNINDYEDWNDSN